MFALEEHIAMMERDITKDIEYFINLNPRFEKNDFRTPLKAYSKQGNFYLYLKYLFICQK